MGILRVGEQRTQDNNGDTKVIKVHRIGWKRIAKNTIRFGWEYVDINGGSNLNLPAAKCGKRRVALAFFRYDDEREAQPKAVRTLEFFYNLVFLIRRIVAFLLPAVIVAGLALSIIKRLDGIYTACMFVFTDFALWIGCIILEEIFARVAAAKLKRDKQVKNIMPVKNNVSDYALNPPQDDDDGVITLKGKNGEDIEFIEMAGIFYNGNSYAILQPVDLLEDMEDDEALVFKVTRGSDGENRFEVELDEKIIDAVFEEYNKLYDEAQKNATYNSKR